jgi:pSer/pThr/pTyr-binding forkhead associated (FHA) protein
MSGRSFLLDRTLLTLGRGSECDIIIPDISISRTHLQFSRQAEADYVRDQDSRSGSYVNGESLQAPRRLRTGDTISLGNVLLEYVQPAEERTTPAPPSLAAGSPLQFPFSLRLPSRMKEE